jgi:hypothetical protein
MPDSPKDFAKESVWCAHCACGLNRRPHGFDATARRRSRERGKGVGHPQHDSAEEAWASVKRSKSKAAGRSARSTRSTAKGKGQSDFSDWPLFNAGNDLLSHTLSRAVQSALRGLTSVFGMGTGGTPAVRSPTSRSCQLSAVSSQLLAGANVSC